jgi:hypothetical protein
MLPALAIVAFVFVFVVIWLGSMSLDNDRISSYIKERGGRVISINWAPFGKGWFGEKNDRIYEVVYYDRVGNQHWATCKTSMMSGVYWTEDRITHHRSSWYESVAPSNEPGHPLIRQIPEEPKEDLVAELHRLREENARLRKRLGDE